MKTLFAPLVCVLPLFLGACRAPVSEYGRQASLELARDDKAALAQQVSVEEALARLKEGNRRFVAAEHTNGQPVGEKRRKTAAGQFPFAVVVGCSDSRTPAELIFDQNLGRLFVVRTAGNLVDGYGLGSVEYAVTHLGCRLIVVMGHDHCGAVKAAVAGGEGGGHLGALVRDIIPAAERAAEMPGDVLDNAIAANVRAVAEKIRKECDFGPHADRVEIVPAVYDLATGEVRWLE